MVLKQRTYNVVTCTYTKKITNENSGEAGSAFRDEIDIVNQAAPLCLQHRVPHTKVGLWCVEYTMAEWFKPYINQRQDLTSQRYRLCECLSVPYSKKISSGVSAPFNADTISLCRYSMVIILWMNSSTSVLLAARTALRAAKVALIPLILWTNENV